MPGDAGAPGGRSRPRRPHRGPGRATFGGVTAVAPVSDTALLVVWNAGVSPATRRRLFVTASTRGPRRHPSLTRCRLLRPGWARSARSSGGSRRTRTYLLGARAVNTGGLEDANTVQKTGTPLNDTSGPTFAGLKAAVPGAGGAVASVMGPCERRSHARRCDVVPRLHERYGGPEDFTKPALVTAPGADLGVRAAPAGCDKGSLLRRAGERRRRQRGRQHQGALRAARARRHAARFAGCTAATTLQAITVGVAWSAATDDVSAPADMTYDVFQSTTSGKFDFTKPYRDRQRDRLRGHPGADDLDHLLLRLPRQGRSRQRRGQHRRGHRHDRGQPRAPTFAGINVPAFVGDPAARTATLSWAAATDVATSSDKIVYDVYESQTMGGEDFTKPPAATSAPGALSIALTGLAPNATTYFVVRARDLDGNRDSNVVEASLTTNVSFALNVQPIFSDDCGVVGCHVPGSPTGGLILAAGSRTRSS